MYPIPMRMWTLLRLALYALPLAVFADSIVSNGIRVDIHALSVALECTMGVDSDGIYGVGVLDQLSPTPNVLLISFPTQLP